ncbi:histidine phosphatase family protein [Arachnia propionica]|uniref:Histidine phosphatase family protein n=1 Tax=Arachnia propionica TaxID=1750 RepID=A0A3P1TAL4_9ACTN|nr:histidine phosphatase family protein [Arachnia propionica]MDO5083216.1 histidine phosphatase family protein [Arachnia propionica]RRD05503.1 histidine phosphatase family protein [Arachnia propionica]
MGEPRIVHVMRHGQVHNPDGVLYGRLPGFGLSELGHRMAERLAEHWDEVPLTHLVCSPLQRAQETLAPTAALFPQLPITTDERVIEAANVFEGKVFGVDNKALRDVRMIRHVLNPFRPSWGEAYVDIAARMRDAIADAAEAAGPGGQALVVSHQLPIEIARRSALGQRLFHDPRRRHCTLTSVTSFQFRDRTLTAVDYCEPAADLLPPKKGIKFRVGT